MFNYNHLYYFYMVGTHGGIMKAAKKLRIAQPSLSSQIKTLEKHLDIALLTKRGRNIALTKEGERVYEFCRRMFETAEDLSEYLKNSSLPGVQRYKIGVTHEIERPFIADMVAGLLKYKNITEVPLISMISGDHSKLMEVLRQGEIDLLVTNQPAHEAGLKTLVDLSMPVIAIITPNLLKKINASRETPLKTFFKKNDVGLVLPTDKLRLRIETDIYCSRHQINNHVLFESDILSIVIKSAMEDLGVAFVPKFYVDKEIKQQSLVTLNKGEPMWEHKLFILTNSGRKTTSFVSQIHEYFKKLGAKTF